VWTPAPLSPPVLACDPQGPYKLDFHVREWDMAPPQPIDYVSVRYKNDVGQWVQEILLTPVAGTPRTWYVENVVAYPPFHKPSEYEVRWMVITYQGYRTFGIRSFGATICCDKLRLW
jgi:hypothetical protein